MCDTYLSDYAISAIFWLILDISPKNMKLHYLNSTWILIINGHLIISKEMFVLICLISYVPGLIL